MIRLWRWLRRYSSADFPAGWRVANDMEDEALYAPLTEETVWGAAQALRPDISHAQFRLMWAMFLRERRRRERSRLYRWATNAWFFITGNTWRAGR